MIIFLASIVLHNLLRIKYFSYIDATNSLAEECMEETFLVPYNHKLLQINQNSIRWKFETNLQIISLVQARFLGNGKL